MREVPAVRSRLRFVPVTATSDPDFSNTNWSAESELPRTVKSPLLTSTRTKCPATGAPATVTS